MIDAMPLSGDYKGMRQVRIFPDGYFFTATEDTIVDTAKQLLPTSLHSLRSRTLSHISAEMRTADWNQVNLPEMTELACLVTLTALMVERVNFPAKTEHSCAIARTIPGSMEMVTCGLKLDHESPEHVAYSIGSKIIWRWLRDV